MTPEDLIRAVNQGEGLDLAQDVIMTLTLISVRMQAFLYLSPFFSKTAMARIVRAGFIVALSIILFPPTFITIRLDPDFRNFFFILVLKEILIGLVLGVMMWMPIRGLDLTGTLLDTQRGSTQAMGSDAVFGGQTTTTALFLLQIFSGYFFAVGGFRLIQNTLFRSAEIWPFTEALPLIEPVMIYKLVDLAGSMFFTAIALAIPISALMLLADIVISFLTKSAPTLNALTFGMPVKSFILSIMLFYYLDIAYPRIMIELDGALAVVQDLMK